jgi:hypothetical protein
MSESKPGEGLISHDANALRHVANVLDVLNAGEDVGFAGELELFWCDVPMGRCVYDEDCESWDYYVRAKEPTDGPTRPDAV